MRELCLVASLLLSSSIAGAAVRFPKPIHIVRRLEDPIAHRVTTVDEYCSGERLVSVNGNKVVITDYDQQQVTEIDRERATYSITPFADVAAAQPHAAATPAANAASAPQWKRTPLGMKSSRGGRSVDTVAFENGGRRMEVGVDRQIALTADGVEALVGAAWPARRGEEHEQMLAAARATKPSRITAQSDTTAPAEYGLPSETALTVEVNGTSLTFRNSVVRVTNETVPDDLLRIAPGSTRIESALTRVARELREADLPPVAARP